MTKYTTEQQVLDKLNIQDFSRMPKKKVDDFVSMLPEIDKDVAIEIIRGLPKFAESAQGIVNSLRDVCNESLNDNTCVAIGVIDGYKKILDTLDNLLQSKDLDKDTIKYIVDKIVETGDKCGILYKEHKDYADSTVERMSSKSEDGISVLKFVSALGVAIAFGAGYLFFRKDK